jgi:hypothetical protein
LIFTFVPTERVLSRTPLIIRTADKQNKHKRTQKNKHKRTHAPQRERLRLNAPTPQLPNFPKSSRL